MSHSDTHLDASEVAGLVRRVRGVGMLLLSCDQTGKLMDPPAPGVDWLADLCCQAPIFTNALKEAASRWSQRSRLAPEEIFPGCWLAAMPKLSRRRRVGYTVAVILSEAFLDCEQLSAMCQAARLDFGLVRSRLVELPPVGRSDVQRTAALIGFARTDQLQLAEDHRAMDSIGQQLAESYEEMHLLYTTIQSMSVAHRPSRFVTIVCEQLLATLPFAWIGAQLAHDPDRLKQLAGQLILAGEPGTDRDTIGRLAERILTEAVPEKPIVLEPATNPKHRAYAELGRTVLVHPVSRDDAIVGVLLAGDKRGADPAISSVDMKLLGATATHLAIFIENATLYDDLNAMFLGTLEALTASIDAKDPYTCGHSQRVAHLTKQLAAAVGLSEHEVNRMHIAGLVHDVGKIGVPERVLTKPGRLTEEEFDWIKKHPEIGHRILKDIPQLRDILPGVLYHHERFDGKGYPEGLSGKNIPPVARLISLADAFDAMSSNRTYRPALSRPDVIRQIHDGAGTQFDPDLAPVFVDLDFSEYDGMSAETRAFELEGPRNRDEAA